MFCKGHEPLHLFFEYFISKARKNWQYIEDSRYGVLPDSIEYTIVIAKLAGTHLVVF